MIQAHAGTSAVWRVGLWAAAAPKKLHLGIRGERGPSSCGFVVLLGCCFVFFSSFWIPLPLTLFFTWSFFLLCIFFLFLLYSSPSYYYYLSFSYCSPYFFVFVFLLILRFSFILILLFLPPNFLFFYITTIMVACIVLIAMIK